MVITPPNCSSGVRCVVDVFGGVNQAWTNFVRAEREIPPSTCCKPVGQRASSKPPSHDKITHTSLQPLSCVPIALDADPRTRGRPAADAPASAQPVLAVPVAVVRVLRQLRLRGGRRRPPAISALLSPRRCLLLLLLHPPSLLGKLAAALACCRRRRAPRGVCGGRVRAGGRPKQIRERQLPVRFVAGVGSSVTGLVVER